MNIKKQKQTHRYKEQTSGYQWGECGGEGKDRSRGLLVALVVKNPLSSARDKRDLDSFLGWEDPLGEEMATLYSIQYSCLETPMDREAWWATIHTVEKRWA